VTTLETDYLVVGAGAMGMAFTDTLVTETDAQVVIVDRGHAPGGHWNRAYPFVRLHQPSAYYGVNSRGLGSDSIDQLGWNKGLFELATVGEIGPTSSG
jgi:cation diffusion facilitator CzcD-associated flavoprotein CzcO